MLCARSRRTTAVSLGLGANDRISGTCGEGMMDDLMSKPDKHIAVCTGVQNPTAPEGSATLETLMFRQGDILIVPVDQLPAGLKWIERENGRVILAHGEVTGHAHAIKDKSAALFRDPKL